MASSRGARSGDLGSVSDGAVRDRKEDSQLPRPVRMCEGGESVRVCSGVIRGSDTRLGTWGGRNLVHGDMGSFRMLMSVAMWTIMLLGVVKWNLTSSRSDNTALAEQSSFFRIDFRNACCLIMLEE